MSAIQWARSLFRSISGKRLGAAGTPAEHAGQVTARQRATVRTRYTWRVLRRGRRDPRLAAHADLLAGTLREVAARRGARVLVDTSKMPAESALLAHLPGITTYYLHLVRDPRAVALSWRYEKEYCYALSARRSTGYWYGFNRAAAALLRRYPDRSVFLRYEDFTADPAGTVAALLRQCGADPAANPVHGRVVELHTNHTVTGNPDRFRTGTTVIRDRDDAWRTGLPRSARLAATVLAGPLLRRYGYTYGGAPEPGRPVPLAVREGSRGSGA